MLKIVSYLRVSTQRQGESGLGLEAQRAAVKAYADRSGAEILREFIEVESGRKTDERRPQLAQALPFARRAGATLVVAKLDRLARNVRFLATVLESDVDFVACDLPAANRLTLHIMAAVAEAEAGMISQRTKAALQAAKARGVLLGSSRPDHWQGREQARIDGLAKGRKASIERRKADAIDAYRDLLPLVRSLRSDGLSLARIAQRLNESGHRTRRGCAFTAVQIQAILQRAGAG